MMVNYDNYSILANALSAVFVPEIINKAEKYDTEHIFSDKYEKRMKKFLKQQKKSYYRLICTTGRRAACIGTAALIAGGTAMSVDAVRDKLIDFIFEHLSDHDEVGVKTNLPDFHKTIEWEYAINVPDGFNQDNKIKTDSYVITSYKSESNYILFHQYTAYDFKSKIYNQNCDIEYYTDENGILYTIYHWTENEGNYNILWERDNYIFQLNSDLDKEEVMKLCTDVKKTGVDIYEKN